MANLNEIKIVDREYLLRQFKNYNTKIVSPAVQDLDDRKVEKVEGYGLSQNDFTDALKAKLDALVTNDEYLEVVRQVESNTSAIEVLNGDKNTEGSVAKTVSDAIAEVIASAPEDFDTLKEISDWLSSHASDAAEMNSQIQENKNNIEELDRRLSDIVLETVDIDFDDLYGDGMPDITITGEEILNIGESITLGANVTGANWSSSDESVATVNNGVVTGVASGIATITASKEDYTPGTKSVTVYPTNWEDKFIEDFHAGTANYGGSADSTPVDQTLNQNKVTVEKKVDKGVKKIILTSELNKLDSWTSTNTTQQDGKHKWFALDFVFDADELAKGLLWNGTIEINEDILDAAEGPNTVTLWLKLDELASGNKTVRIVNKEDNNDVETIVISLNDISWEDKFIEDFHAGTANYGGSADSTPVDQTLNQNKVTVEKKVVNNVKTIELTTKLDELSSWTSTNTTQQDGKHKWFALDFVFDADELAKGLLWNGTIEINEDILDAAEGPNTVTLWLKLDELASGNKTVRIVNKEDNNDVETIVISLNDISNE